MAVLTDGEAMCVAGAVIFSLVLGLVVAPSRAAKVHVDRSDRMDRRSIRFIAKTMLACSANLLIVGGFLQNKSTCVLVVSVYFGLAWALMCTNALKRTFAIRWPVASVDSYLSDQPDNHDTVAPSTDAQPADHVAANQSTDQPADHVAGNESAIPRGPFYAEDADYFTSKASIELNDVCKDLFSEAGVKVVATNAAQSLDKCIAEVIFIYVVQMAMLGLLAYIILTDENCECVPTDVQPPARLHR